MIVELHAKSDVGRIRSGNEDNFLLLDLSSGAALTGSEGGTVPATMNRFDLGENGLILVVSDGMGGALAGDVASRMAVEIVRDRMTEVVHEAKPTAADNHVDMTLIKGLREAVLHANTKVHDASLSDARFSGMGATFTGAAVSNNFLDLVQVGDSRAYLIRDNQIKLATKDQSLVQQLVDVGTITEADAETHMFRNVILQALGAQSEIIPVTGRTKLYRDDVLLICSDGLSGKLRAEDMFQIVREAEGDLSLACDRLVQEANVRGGEDNITVILARFTGDDLADPQSSNISIEHLQWPEENTLMDQHITESDDPDDTQG
jgi:protein phosphatase